MIDERTRARLVDLARQAIRTQVLGASPPPVPVDLTIEASGLFVTLSCDAELRGCLGVIRDEVHVANAVAQLAMEVCHKDSRFKPVAARELSTLDIELSVMTPLSRVLDVSTIETGRHGLVVEQGRQRGLLLPQVATEHRWGRETFLAHTCVKAGLSPAAWQQGAQVFSFEAEVFGGPFQSEHEVDEDHEQ